MAKNKKRHQKDRRKCEKAEKHANQNPEIATQTSVWETTQDKNLGKMATVI